MSHPGAESTPRKSPTSQSRLVESRTLRTGAISSDTKSFLECMAEDCAESESIYYTESFKCDDITKTCETSPGVERKPQDELIIDGS